MGCRGIQYAWYRFEMHSKRLLLQSIQKRPFAKPGSGLDDIKTNLNKIHWRRYGLHSYLILPAALGPGVYSASNRN
jgi:hypothetical protein